MFQGSYERHPTPQRLWGALPKMQLTSSRVDLTPRYHAMVKKKRKLFRDYHIRLPPWFKLPSDYQHSWFTNINAIPFRIAWRGNRSLGLRELPCYLGSTHPCSTWVHMEPFPTSVFKDLIWIFATTTKICTSQKLSAHSHDALLSLENAPPTHELFSIEKFLKSRLRLGRSLERHPFSGPVHSAGELLQYP